MSDQDNRHNMPEEMLKKLREDGVSEREIENLKKISKNFREIEECIVDNLVPKDMEYPPNPVDVENKLFLVYMGEVRAVFSAITATVLKRWPEMLERAKDEAQNQKQDQQQKVEDPFSKVITGKVDKLLN